MKSGLMQKVAIVTGIGVGVSVSAALIRSLLIKRRGVSNEVLCEDNNNGPVELKLEVPRKSLGCIIGKRGVTIKRLREESGATIKLWDQSEELALVVIRGQRENAEAAMKEVKKLLASSPRVFTKDVTLTEGTWAAVVGVNGDNVRQISSESKAALTVKWLVPHDSEIENNSCKYVVTVRGSREQIDCALSLIDEQVAQASVMPQNKMVSLVGRSLLENVVPAMPGTVSRELFPTNSADGFVQVLVSAVQSPSHFWVQLCGPKSIQLDKLISEMTEFYKSEIELQSSPCRFQSVFPGDLVAAYYDGDKDWYRALVLSVEKLSNNRMAATVLFVDFGDSAVVELGMLLKLKPEYLAIPLQAIKCSLYDVTPIADERWTQEAIHLFENLTYLAQWKPIMAKPILPSENSVTSMSSSGSALSNETVDIVQVILIDTNGSEDISISQELIRNGHAIERKANILEKMC